jgi:hypothetical protein
VAVPQCREGSALCAVRLSLFPPRTRERGQVLWRWIGLTLSYCARFRIASRAALASPGHPRYSRFVILAAAVPVSYKSVIQVLSSRCAANYVSKRTAGTRRGSSAALLASGRLTRR